MNGKYLILLSVIAATCTMSNAASYSSSCVYINGEQKCTSNQDPNGNMAGAAAGVNGNRGSMASGAGNPRYFTINRDQMVYGGNNPDEAGDPGSNPNGQQFPDYGTNGGGGMAYAGTGTLNLPGFYYGTNGGGGMAYASTGNSNFQAFNPEQFVRDFFGGRRKR